MSVIRWVITYLNDNMTRRHLVPAFKNTKSYSTRTEAKSVLHELRSEYTHKYDIQHLEVRPALCSDVHGEPLDCWFDDLVEPTNVGFAPHEVPAWHLNDLTNCFGRFELESAALVLVTAADKQCDWSPMPTFAVDNMAKDPRVLRWRENPFFAPDWGGLAKRGYIRFSKPTSAAEVLMVGFEPLFFDAIRKRVAEHQTYLADVASRYRWMDDGGADLPQREEHA